VRRALAAVAAALAVAGLAVAAHFALIELDREVVTLRTRQADGSWRQTRLWVVDQGGDAWLHSEGALWRARFGSGAVVELLRAGQTRRYIATPAPGPHPSIDAALRDKYGLADRWVRFVAPCTDDTLVVRLRILDAAGGEASPGRQRAVSRSAAAARPAMRPKTMALAMELPPPM
jgi:hypothetical protein